MYAVYLSKKNPGAQVFLLRALNPVGDWDTEADCAWERLLMASVKLTAKQVNRKPRGQIQGVEANGTGQ